MYCKGRGSRLISLILSFVLMTGMVSGVFAVDGKAEEPFSVDITKFNGFINEKNEKIKITGRTGTKDDPDWAQGAFEIKIQLPEEYNTFPELNAAGLTTLQVDLTLQSYSGNSSSGFQLFSYSKDRNGTYEWDNKGRGKFSESWYYCRNMINTSYTTTYNFSPLYSNNLLYLGIQFAKLNLDTDVTFTIDSVKLVAGQNKHEGYDTKPVADTIRSSNFDPDPNYAKLVQESLYFFDMNMCGSDVDEKCGVTWRGDCHIYDETTYDGKKVDVSGGYHDAGDHVKFGLTQAYAATMLGTIYKEYEADFIELGQDEHIKMHLNRFADYFKNCTVMDDEGNVEAFCYQVGDFAKDHTYWGAPEDQKGDRTEDIKFTSANNPCTDIVAETAAALAIHSIIFENKESLTYAKALLEYAENTTPMSCVNAERFYKGSSYEDDLALASFWIFTASKDFSYRSKYLSYMNSMFTTNDKDKQVPTYWTQCWNDVWAAFMLAMDYNTLDSLIEDRIKNISPNGYAYIDDDSYATARYNTTLQFIALALDKHRKSSVYGTWATGQMNYLLGNNPVGKCFVIGYNDRSVLYPHHRAASGYTVEVQPTTLPAHLMLGTLMGGPEKDDTFTDDASIWKTNEVALDYQTGLVGAAIALYHIHKNDTEADNKLHSKAYLKTYEISEYYVNDNVDPYHEHNVQHIDAKAATCSKEGNIECWYCDRCETYFSSESCETGTELSDEDRVIPIDENAHDYGEVTYIWAEDNSTVSGNRICKNDPKHFETETVKTKYEVLTEATYEKEGVGRFTSEEFENEIFAVQTKDVVIPVKEKPVNTEDDPKPAVEPKPVLDPSPVVEPKGSDSPKTDEGQKAEDGTAVGVGASEAVADQAITTCDDDEGPEGSAFGILQAKMKKVSKDSITLSWQKQSGADYVIYANECGKMKKFEKIATAHTNTFTIKKLKKGTCYKCMIVAVKDGKVVSTSKTLHIATAGGKLTNPSKVTLNKKSVKLKKNKSFKLKAKLVKQDKKLKIPNHRKVRFESSDPAVASVDAKGKIKAMDKGKATIFVYAQDGVYAKIKVTVK